MKNIQRYWWLIGGTVIVCATLVAGIFWWLKSQSSVELPRPSAEEVVMQGSLVCLPKKGDGPHTMECAYGLLSEDRYYALQSQETDSFDLFSYSFDDVIEVSGTLTSPDPNSSYAVEGVIEIKSVELIQGAS